MMGQTHLAIGFLAGLLTFNIFDANPFLFIPLVLLGALLPDVDHEKSKINRMLPVTRWIPWFFTHRGFFHSIFPVAILLFGLYFAGYISFAIPLAIGYVSHLLSDCLTRQGCNLLHPISKLRVQGFIMTGGITELIILGAVLVLDALLLARFAGLI